MGKLKTIDGYRRIGSVGDLKIHSVKAVDGRIEVIGSFDSYVAGKANGNGDVETEAET